MLYLAAYAASQPSLGRVAVVLFMRTLYDDRNRKCPDMKRNPHTHHPLFRGWSSRLRICCSLFGLLGFPVGMVILIGIRLSCQSFFHAILKPLG